MPRRDRTRRAGLGRMTGRASGYRAGDLLTGYLNLVRRSVSWGWARRRGRGSVHQYPLESLQSHRATSHILGYAAGTMRQNDFDWLRQQTHPMGPIEEDPQLLAV